LTKKKIHEGRSVDLTLASAGPVWRQYLRAIGPGLITGASDDDPSAIVTYATAGARTGYSFLWACPLAFPLMVAVELAADRIALATGENVGTLARRHFGPLGRRTFAVLLTLHLAANGLVIAADLGAVGDAVHLLHLGPASLWSVVAGIAVGGLIASGSFAAVARVLKVLCLALLGYVIVLAVIDVPWGTVLRHTVVPSIPHDQGDLQLLVAVLGATLPPYVFLWQGNHRLEEMREEDAGGDEPLPLDRRPSSLATRRRRTSALDVASGMVFAVAVMFAVIVATAASTSGRGGTIDSAADAARALEPVAGGAASAVFAFAILGAGLLAVPVLAGAASSALAAFSRRPWGYSRSVRDAPAFYVLVALGVIGGGITAVSGVDPVRLLLLAATVNGITAAPLLAIVMRLAGDRDLLGQQRPGPVMLGIGWFAVALMGVAAAGTLLLMVAPG
jgi:Mn2+/Fe2+ NRAMP family transporter